MLKWYETEQADQGAILGGQVCLVRNLKNYLFEDKIGIDKQKELLENVCYVVREVEGSLGMKFTFVNLTKGSEQAHRRWVGRLAVPPLMLYEGHESGILISEDETVSILINGKEHICIQVSCAGARIEQAINTANEVDDALNEHLEYAYSNKYGYLTSDPCLTGTGLSASYLMHLPYLEKKKYIARYEKELGQYGFTMRGHFEGCSFAPGSVYRIKNRNTLGISESEIISSLNSLCSQLMIQEENVEDRVFNENRLSEEDGICRSYGLLKYARSLDYEETLEFISSLFTGRRYGMLADEKGLRLLNLMINIHPAVLEAEPEVYKDAVKMGKVRADYVRSVLPELIV